MSITFGCCIKASRWYDGRLLWMAHWESSTR
jgi:hypothetical protein